LDKKPPSSHKNRRHQSKSNNATTFMENQGADLLQEQQMRQALSAMP